MNLKGSIGWGLCLAIRASIIPVCNFLISPFFYSWLLEGLFSALTTLKLTLVLDLGLVEKEGVLECDGLGSFREGIERSLVFSHMSQSVFWQKNSLVIFLVPPTTSLTMIFCSLDLVSQEEMRCSYPCHLCEVHKDNLLEKVKTRTIGGIFNDYEGYTQYCLGKNKKQQQEGARMFHSVTYGRKI